MLVGFANGADVLDVGAICSVTVQAAPVSHGVSRCVVWVVAFTALVDWIVIRDVDTQGHAIVDTGVCSECEKFCSRNLLRELLEPHGNGVTGSCPTNGVSLPGDVILGKEAHDVFRACAFGDIHDVKAVGARFVNESEVAFCS